MYIPLIKADAAQRLVYGSFDETPDRAGEICDYATARPAFEAWSAEMQKASGGKSLGNIRGQHDLKKAAGKLTDLTFDDAARRIDFVAHIVDDGEWKKVEEGVYTGFSPGGRYAKRWQDGAHKRYTPIVGELSIVDLPCNPAAGFTMIKADGSEESREFVLDKAYEPGNEATLARADELAKAAGKARKDFVVQARAELIAEEAASALAKMAVEPEAKPDPVAAIEAALAKADAIAADEPGTTVLLVVPEQFADLAKTAAALRLIGASVDDQPILAKGLYTLERVACCLDRFADILTSVAWEEKYEANDGATSELPAKAAEIVGKLRDFLIAMAQEETAELLAEIGKTLPDLVIAADGATDADMALASSIVDLVKSDTALMEKAGARNSKRDATKLQAMHDHSVELGATCAMKKAEELTVENDRLTKAFGEAVPKIEALADRLNKVTAQSATDRDALAKAQAQIDELLKRPEMAKGVIFAIDKEKDGQSDASTEKPNQSFIDRLAALPPGPKRAQMLLGQLPR